MQVTLAADTSYRAVFVPISIEEMSFASYYLPLFGRQLDSSSGCGNERELTGNHPRLRSMSMRAATALELCWKLCR